MLAPNYANDAKTFLKHFSDCLFYFCSTCADCFTAHCWHAINTRENISTYPWCNYIRLLQRFGVENIAYRCDYWKYTIVVRYITNLNVQSTRHICFESDHIAHHERQNSNPEWRQFWPSGWWWRVRVDRLCWTNGHRYDTCEILLRVLLHITKWLKLRCFDSNIDSCFQNSYIRK